jgi:hypothetical protein
MNRDDKAKELILQYHKPILGALQKELNKMVSENPGTTKEIGFAATRSILSILMCGVLGSEIEQSTNYQLNDMDREWIQATITDFFGDIIKQVVKKNGIDVNLVGRLL